MWILQFVALSSPFLCDDMSISLGWGGNALSDACEVIECDTSFAGTEGTLASSLFDVLGNAGNSSLAVPEEVDNRLLIEDANALIGESIEDILQNNSLAA